MNLSDIMYAMQTEFPAQNNAPQVSSTTTHPSFTNFFTPQYYDPNTQAAQLYGYNPSGPAYLANGAFNFLSSFTGNVNKTYVPFFQKQEGDIAGITSSYAMAIRDLAHKAGGGLFGGLF